MSNEWENFMKRDTSKVKDKSLEFRTGLNKEIERVLSLAKDTLNSFSDFNNIVRKNEKFKDKIQYVAEIIKEFQSVKKLLIKLDNLRKK